MATTTVTLTIQNSDFANFGPPLCAAWNQPVTAAGAKQALILYVQSVYAQSLIDTAVPAAANTAAITAQNTANAVVIT